MGTDFFVTVFDWIDYILPIGREKALEDVEYQHVNFLMTAFTHSALYTVLEVFQYLPHEQLREIILHPEQRLSAILVRAWLKWPRLQRLLREGEKLDAKIVEGCAIGFPMFYRTLQDDDLRHKVLSELMHPIGYNPRRFWLRYARHIRLTRGCEDCTAMAYMRNLLGDIVYFTAVPGFTKLPEKLTMEMVDCLRYQILRKSMAGIWRQAWVSLSPLCMMNTHTLACALKHGLLECLVRIRIKHGRNTPGLAEMATVMHSVVTLPSAIRAFYDAYTELMERFPSISFDEEEKRVIKAFLIRHRLLQDADACWRLVNTCCNAAQAAAKTVPSVHVYAVKRCTARGRASVRIGEKADTNNNALLAIIPKDAIDLRPLSEGREVEIDVRPLDLRGRSLPAWQSVDIIFLQHGKACTRRMHFMSEARAGQVRMPFRLLTESFFNDRRSLTFEQSTPAWRTPLHTMSAAGSDNAALRVSLTVESVSSQPQNDRART
ncbi:hypothetical protein K525DRAFT_186845 [Schizophyllum commune Loenen D]|nr:hypothetical protein K525DRAFT_186845 [Schizophyllum commune Loenen D]